MEVEVLQYGFGLCGCESSGVQHSILDSEAEAHRCAFDFNCVVWSLGVVPQRTERKRIETKSKT